jgi:hypothetical protein
MYIAGADPGFQVRGGHLKKLRRAEGGAKFLDMLFLIKEHTLVFCALYYITFD